MLIRFFNYLIGYVEVVVTGTLIERFINICIKNGIYLWDICAQDDGMHMCVSKKGFCMMRNACRKTKCRCRIVAKKGYSFAIKKHRKRKFLLFGLLFFTAMIMTLSSFIWVVKIEGNVSVPSSDIMAVIDSCGLRQGVIKYTIDSDEIQKKALHDEPRLSWLWVDVKGTVAHVEVKERAIADAPVDVTKPCDVIASQSGVIRSMIVRRGNALCSVGDTVSQGQVLVSAYKGELTPVHADADVVAAVWYEREKEISLNHEVSQPTGKSHRRYSVAIGDKVLNLWFKQDVSYQNYTQTEDSCYVRLWRDLYLPVKITEYTYFEEAVSVQRLTKEQAVLLAQEEITDAFIKEIGNSAVIVGKTLNVTEKEADKLSVKVVFECEKEIDLKQAADSQNQIIQEPEES